MIDKWTIKPNPDKKDPNRHLLFLKTDMKDLQKVIRKVGMKGGRPTPTKTAPFSHEVVLKEADKQYRDDLKEFLRQIAKPDAEMGDGAEAAASAPTAVAAPPPAPPAPAPRPAAPAPQAAPPPPPPPPAAAPTPAPAPVPVARPAAPAPQAAPPPPPPPPPPAPEPAAPALEEGPQLIPAQPPEFTIILRPKSDLESFIVGPFNRFAHAACMSVVENPGSMYNPLVVSGEPGAGKSHILNAMAVAMGKKNKTVLTDGVRLAEKANSGGLAAALNDLDVVLIDDVHLLATVEVKSGAVSGVLRDFIGKGKQIVLGSLFPPRMLAGVEDILGFDLARGSAVELKAAPPPARKTIFAETSKRGSVRLGDEEWKLVEALPQAEMLALLEDLRRFKTFKPDTDQKKLFPELLAAGAAPDAGAVKASSSYAPPMDAPAIIPLALLFPAGAEAEGLFALARIIDAAKKQDVPIGFKIILKKGYDPAQSQGLPAALAKECRAAGAGAALIIGPAAGSPLAAREREFAHLLLHTLNSNAICTGWVGHASIGSPGAALRALMNLQE